MNNLADTWQLIPIPVNTTQSLVECHSLVEHSVEYMP